MEYSSEINANSHLKRMLLLLSSYRIACLCPKHDGPFRGAGGARLRHASHGTLLQRRMLVAAWGGTVSYNLYSLRRPKATTVEIPASLTSTQVSISQPRVPLRNRTARHSTTFHIGTALAVCSQAANHNEALMRDVFPSTPWCGCRNEIGVTSGT